MNAVTFAISSSVRLASAEPFPVTPAGADVDEHFAVELQLFR